MKIPALSYDELVHRIYNINEKDFEGVAMQVWNYQFTHNPTYRHYCSLIDVTPEDIKSITDIPFLPIALFKNHVIKTGSWDTQTIFRSSGTTGSIQSAHHVRDLDWYHKVAVQGFEFYFDDPAQLVWLGLLPSYLDRPDSSLVDMVNAFMRIGNRKDSAFFPEISEGVVEKLERLADQNERVMLIGVTFALLDVFEQYDVPVWDKLTVIETGGMKGRGKELTRDEVYASLRKKHPNLRISSEYGMTELTSQAYMTDGDFRPIPQMRVLVRDISDPLTILPNGQRGVLNIIDLANVNTCAFIATDDIGVVVSKNNFQVLGRLDNSDLRGCNLLYT